MESPTVTTNDGKVKGTQRININNEKFFAFFGIPYAKPPVGDLRFKAPEPVDPWNDVKDATQEADPCYQRSEMTFVLEGSEGGCLHLNIYTKTLPSQEHKLKPVMVWIHGGGFKHGSNTPKIYGPEFLLTEDIVLVAINYRLGFLGFLHLNDPTLDVPGNAGLKDQQLALRWVQKNIQHFNGDPNNVTIFGESAGSASVHYHVVSPSSKGLFHKAIMQSGSLHNPWPYSKDVALEFAQSIKSDIKTEKEALELLKSLPVEKLYEYEEKFNKMKGDWGITAPNIEYPNKTAFITAPPTQLIASGQYNKVPILMGCTNREGLLFQAMNNLKKASGNEVSNDINLTKLIHPHSNLKEDDPKRQVIAQKYGEFYFKGENAKDKIMLFTDFFFNSGIIASAKNHAKTSNHPVYLYQMIVDAGLNAFKKLTKVEEPGACHADDLGYLFNAPAAAHLVTRGPLENRIINYFVKMWTNFARTSNPTPPGNDLNITWNPVTENELHYLEIGEELVMRKDLEAERVKFWSEIYKMSPFTAGYL